MPERGLRMTIRAAAVDGAIILGLRMFAPATAAARIVILRPRSGIPYGIAIAAGALITLAVQRR